MEVFGFAFTRRNISCHTLYNLKAVTDRYLLWGEASMDRYIKKLIESNPEYILGLGIYTGRDNESIRIESNCSNKFRTKLKDGNTLRKIEINNFILPSDRIVYANGIGVGYCNLISYKVMKLIETEQIQSKFSFLHIPRRFNKDMAYQEIEMAVERAIRA